MKEELVQQLLEGLKLRKEVLKKKEVQQKPTTEEDTKECALKLLESFRGRIGQKSFETITGYIQSHPNWNRDRLSFLKEHLEREVYWYNMEKK